MRSNRIVLFVNEEEEEEEEEYEAEESQNAIEPEAGERKFSWESAKQRVVLQCGLFSAGPSRVAPRGRGWWWWWW